MAKNEGEPIALNVGRFVINLIPPVVSVREATRTKDLIKGDPFTLAKFIGYADLVVNVAMVGVLAAFSKEIVTPETASMILKIYLAERLAVALLGTVWQGMED